MRSCCPLLLRPTGWLVGLLLLGGCEEVKVTAVEVAQVEVVPSEGRLSMGESLQLTAVPRDRSGNPLRDRPISWSSSDPAVALVSAEGIVRAESSGIASIRASVGGVEGTANVQVMAPARLGVQDRIEIFGRLGEGAPSPVVLQVSNTGEAPITELEVEVRYPDEAPVGWLTADVEEADGSHSVVLRAGTVGLSAGTHHARLLLSSPRADNSPVSVDVEFHLGEAAPSIQLSGAALGFASEAGQAPPPARKVEVWNGGGGELTGLEVSVAHAAGQPSGWLEATLGAQSAPTDLEIRAIPGDLSNGTYDGLVILSSSVATNSPREVLVRLTIGDAAPEILVSPDHLEFTAVEGGASPPPLVVQIENSGGGALSELSTAIVHPSGEPTGWLTAELGKSTAPTEVTVAAQTGDLPAGNFSAVIAVQASGATNSPQSIDVVFRVTAEEEDPEEEDPGEENGSEGEDSEEEAEGDDSGEDEDSGEEEDPEEDPEEEDPGDEDEDDPEDDPEADDQPVASVPEITYRTLGGPNDDRHLRISMRVVDQGGDPVSGASVSITLTNTDSGEDWNQSSTTDKGGTVTFSLNNHPAGCYETEIRSISATGYEWDGETPDNEFCASS